MRNVKRKQKSITHQINFSKNLVTKRRKIDENVPKFMTFAVFVFDHKKVKQRLPMSGPREKFL